MKVAFGTTLLDKGLLGEGIDGIGQYCQELLHHFSSASDNLEISPYSFGINKSACGAYILPAYTNYLVKSLLRTSFNHYSDKHYFDSVNVVHSTDQLMPIVRDKPLIATVMDTIPLSHPQFLRTQSRILKPYLWKKFTQRANHIITISEFSKSEIINLMEVPEEKVTSIPLGVNQKYFKRISESAIQSALIKFKINKPFFLFIGSIQPRKNLKKIIAAHAALPRNMATEFPLVIVGKQAWSDKVTNTAIQNGILEKRCIWLSYISEFEKCCLLQSALGLVFASLYEGFGLPILEAFASQCPVITSNITSMPEVAFDAAILVDPYNQDAITDAMTSFIDKPNMIEGIKVKGLERSKLYTWSQTADKTRDIYSLFEK
jgi:glycosyltransferase involved in cell wall biosynthesis